MFIGFLFHLRAYGLKVSVTEWMALTEALARGHAHASLSRFYGVARALLVKRETQLDLYDRAFASYFEGVTDTFTLDEEVLRWLQSPKLPRPLSNEELARLKSWDLDTLRRELEKRLREQKERHDGGNYWIGTGGTSPFGNGGYNPQGVRIGGQGGGRSAVAVAGDRRFRNLSGDRVLDTRDFAVALRRLKRLTRQDGPLELDVERTIDKSARDGGEIDLVFVPPRKNRVKLLLLMDVGGTMDPYTLLCEQLFSAAQKALHFKAKKHYFFHNCIYDKLYTDISQYRGRPTAEVLREVDGTWSVVLVGDAWMNPYELTHQYGAVFYGTKDGQSGLDWLGCLRRRCPSSVWLNPEPQRVWDAPTIALIRRIFPMYELSVAGLTQAVDVLRGSRPNVAAFDSEGDLSTGSR